MIWTTMTIVGLSIALTGLGFSLISLFRKKYKQVYFGYVAIFVGTFFIIYELIS